VNLSWLADQFADIEARNARVTKICLPALDAEVRDNMHDKTLWGAKVVVKPELGRTITLSYERFDPYGRPTCKTTRRTVALP